MEPTCFEDYGFSLIEKFVGDLAEPLWVKVTGGDAGTEFQLNLDSPAMVSGIRGIAGAGANVDLNPDMVCPEMTKWRDDGNYLRIWVETNDDIENSVFYMAYADIQEAYQQRMLELGLPIPEIPAIFHG